MRRRVLDLLASAIGAVVVVGLLAAGSLAMWGYAFANASVHTQLARQEITFPPKAAFAHPKAGTEITPGMIPSVSQYAGLRLTTGPQAAAYANDFIGAHLSEMPYGGVYSKISAAARANPRDASLQALVQTSFQGTTLRGLLLEAYGFWVFGQIALWAGIVAFCMAGVLALLVLLGLWHARRVSSDAQILGGRSGKLQAA